MLFGVNVSYEVKETLFLKKNFYSVHFLYVIFIFLYSSFYCSFNFTNWTGI